MPSMQERSPGSSASSSSTSSTSKAPWRASASWGWRVEVGRWRVKLEVVHIYHFQVVGWLLVLPWWLFLVKVSHSCLWLHLSTCWTFKGDESKPFQCVALTMCHQEYFHCPFMSASGAFSFVSALGPAMWSFPSDQLQPFLLHCNSQRGNTGFQLRSPPIVASWLLRMPESRRLRRWRREQAQLTNVIFII